jgi:hypothetical protein
MAQHGLRFVMTNLTLLAVVACAAAVTCAQDSTTTVCLAPAVETVSTTTASAAAAYFTGEAVQLTDSALANVTETINNDTISSLFAFESNTTVSKRAASVCKVMPGDLLWPITLIWDVFDLLLGGALIKTSPLAASCYPARPEYNAETCATITAAWLTSDLQ